MLNSLDGYIARMLEISNKKYILLQDMLVLTQTQSEAIRDGSLEALQKCIDDKQIKIESIDKLDEEFSVYFRRFKQQLNIKTLDELDASKVNGVKELQECISRVMKLMNKISENEKQNNSKANNLLNEFGQEIKTLNQGKKVNTAYSSYPAFKAPSYFIDKKK